MPVTRTSHERRPRKDALPTDRQRRTRKYKKQQRQGQKLFMDLFQNLGTGQEGKVYRKVPTTRAATRPLNLGIPCRLVPGVNHACEVLLLRQGPPGPPVSQVVGGELTVRMLEFAPSIGLQGKPVAASLSYRIARVVLEGLRPKGAGVPEGHRPKGPKEAAGK